MATQLVRESLDFVGIEAVPICRDQPLGITGCGVWLQIIVPAARFQCVGILISKFADDPELLVKGFRFPERGVAFSDRQGRGGYRYDQQQGNDQARDNHLFFHTLFSLFVIPGGTVARV